MVEIIICCRWGGFVLWEDARGCEWSDLYLQLACTWSEDNIVIVER
jgi:hypothetical protein